MNPQPLDVHELLDFQGAQIALFPIWDISGVNPIVKPFWFVFSVSKIESLYELLQ